MANFINIVFALIGAVIFVGIVLRFSKDIFSKEKTIYVTVTDKKCYKKVVYSKMQAPNEKKKYTITFLSKNSKKLYFDVNEFSYKDFKIGEKGNLTYKGNKLIEFK